MKLANILVYGLGSVMTQEFLKVSDDPINPARCTKEEENDTLFIERWEKCSSLTPCFNDKTSHYDNAMCPSGESCGIWSPFTISRYKGCILT